MLVVVLGSAAPVRLVRPVERGLGVVMTRRRNPPPRRPSAGGRASGKDKEQVENELRIARAARKAESQSKHQLRRWDWEAAENEEDGADEDGLQSEIADEDSESNEAADNESQG